MPCFLVTVSHEKIHPVFFSFVFLLLNFSFLVFSFFFRRDFFNIIKEIYRHNMDAESRILKKRH